MNTDIALSETQSFVSQIQATPSKVLGSFGQEAFEDLANIPFPVSKSEAWKYTRVGKIKNATWTVNPGACSSIEAFKIPDLEAKRLVFVDGVVCPFLSELNNLEDGLSISALGDVTADFGKNLKPERELFECINASLCSGGAFIKVAKGKVINTALHIIHVQTTANQIANPRFVFDLEAFAQLKVVISFKSTTNEATFTNAVTDSRVGDNASLEINKIQYEGDEQFHMGTDLASQNKDSLYTINTLSLAGGWIRNNLNIDVDGQNCNTHLNGLYILDGKQHVDNHTVLDHKVPNCDSFETYKGLIGGSSTAVFNGKVFVRPDAQKTNAYQQNANILLSTDAKVNSKPELEIYADDVKCSHGSTTGQFDEEALFYLQARGIGRAKAQNLLVYAFAADVLEKISIPEVYTYITSLLKQRFSWEEL